MFQIETLLLVGAVLTLLGILSSKISSRASVPVLVLFLGVGMLAGSEGLGGIEFEDYRLAHAVGTLALALILLDGGLRTPMDRDPLGVEAGGAARHGGGRAHGRRSPARPPPGWWGCPCSRAPAREHRLLHGCGGGLLDPPRAGAPAPERLGATLEVESGSNDPMAIFLTVGLIQIALGEMAPGLPLVGFFVMQMVAGGAIGLAMGALGARLVNAIDLDAAGLYPILVATLGLLSFGAADLVGGNGFLSIYLTGIVMGNRPLVFRRGILLFHDGTAWMAQIAMFVILGCSLSRARSGPRRRAGSWWPAC
jgi:potassium/hydrogen antiporter